MMARFEQNITPPRPVQPVDEPTGHLSKSKIGHLYNPKIVQRADAPMRCLCYTVPGFGDIADMIIIMGAL